MDQIVSWAGELQSLAQAGLYYSRDVYDQERFQRVREIAAEMLAERTGLSLEKVQELFCADVGYQTPKIDTRAAIFQEGRILLVQERSGGWALPGGWCEYNLSPGENVVKEAKEEAGLDVRVLSLIAVQDRARHNLPAYAYGVVKMFFLCQAIGGGFQANSETLASAYFSEDALPPMAEEKCSREQVLLCFRAMREKQWTTLFE